MAIDEGNGEVPSYWYAGESASAEGAVEVLKAMRRFHAADVDMRQRVGTGMDMNDTDLSALRHLIAAESTGSAISPKDLARELGISSAATAKLLARMVGSGHIRREPNPQDRRAQLLHPTPSAHHEAQKTLGSMHQRMLAVAADLTADQQKTVIRFLDQLSDAVHAPKEMGCLDS